MLYEILQRLLPPAAFNQNIDQNITESQEELANGDTENNVEYESESESESELESESESEYEDESEPESESESESEYEDEDELGGDCQTGLSHPMDALDHNIDDSNDDDESGAESVL
tara:strand:- start:279 stop:626 length:348 start_codon:yes stop_codon:yes gene_type:complete